MRPVCACAALLLLGCDPSPATDTAPTAAAGPTAAAAVPPAPATAAWPPLPKDAAEAGALVRRAVRRPPAGEPMSWTAEAVNDAVRASLVAGRGSAGLRQIAAALAPATTPAFILFGSYHDSAAQLDLFRQLVGPLGIRQVERVAIEQLRADGQWGKAPPAEQQGDDALLRRWHQGGELAELLAIHDQQRLDDYTAYKYGYLHGVVDLLTTGRAAGREVVGCDAPAKLQQRMRAVAPEQTDALRELHCAFALQQGVATVTALFYGQAHVRAAGLSRFLPADASVRSVLMFGGRHGEAGIAPQLGKLLRLAAPLLIHPAGGEDLLLLADRYLELPVDRVRTGGPAPTGRLVVQSDAAGVLHVGRQRIEVTAGETSDTISPGAHAFLFIPMRGPAIAGALEPGDGSVEIDITISPPAIRIVEAQRRAGAD